jgi:hypothetical protein
VGGLKNGGKIGMIETELKPLMPIKKQRGKGNK